MAKKRRKGVVPPQLRAYLFKRRSAGKKTRTKVVTVARRKARSFKRHSSSSKFSKLTQPAIGGAIAGLALRFAPQQYNTRLVRLGVGAAAVMWGPKYVDNAGEILIGMEIAKMVATSDFSLNTAPTSSGSGVIYN